MAQTMQTTQRVGVLTLMVVEKDNETGETWVSLWPLPYGLAVLTAWLTTLWVTGSQVSSRMWLEIARLIDDLLLWLSGPVGPLDSLVARCYTATTMLEIIIRALWWAIRSSLG